MRSNKPSHLQPFSYIKIALLAVVLVTSFTVYDFMFIQNVSAVDTGQQVDQTNTAVASSTTIENAIIDKINSIRLDVTIFSDPLFSSLADYTVPINPVPAGRTNPFASFAGEVTGPQTTQTTQTTPTSPTKPTTKTKTR